MDPSNEATGLLRNSIYQDFDEKSVNNTFSKSEKSTVKSSNKKKNETFPQNSVKKIIFKPDETSKIPMSKSLNIKSHSQNNFLKNENVKTAQTTKLSIVESPSYSIDELLLKILEENPEKNNFFGKGEKTFGIVISDDINKISDEYKKYDFHKITKFIYIPHDHFIISVNSIIKLIKNIFIYVDLKLYSESEQLFFGDLDSSEQSFVYSLCFNFNNSLINNFNYRNKIKIGINVCFYKNIKYTSTFGNAFAKIINEYSIIHQIIKDILIKGYYFILFQEKIELYKVNPLLEKREIRILYSIPFGQNLIDDFLDKKNAERIEQIEQSDYFEFCNNKN